MIFSDDNTITYNIRTIHHTLQHAMLDSFMSMRCGSRNLLGLLAYGPRPCGKLMSELGTGMLGSWVTGQWLVPGCSAVLYVYCSAVLYEAARTGDNI